MNDQSSTGSDPSAAFLKLWTESFSKVAQAAWSFSPDNVPPEMLRQIRGSLFQALAQSWDEFLHSPQFLEGMKQMMDNAIAFRKFSTEILTKARHDLAGTAQDDVATLMLTLRRLEENFNSRLDDLGQRVEELGRQIDHRPPAGPARDQQPSPAAASPQPATKPKRAPGKPASPSSSKGRS